MNQSPVARFGPFAFDQARMVLQRDGRLVPIGGRAAALLVALVEAGGDVVTKAELLDAAWPGQAVEERNLSVQIAALRKAMGDLPDGLDPIRTVSRVGYRLMLDAPRAMILTLRPSVAVLPFANLTSDPELAFFADGVTEDVIAALSRFRTFAVVARGSSFAAARGAPAAEAATALGVRYIVEGSVRREGRRLRVAAQLTDGAGLVLWSDRFEEELGGVFDMQDRITAAVVSLAEPRITHAELDRSRRKHPENLDAYDHFLRGTALLNQLNPSAATYDEMVHHLGRAAILDPSFPQALAFAGWAHELRRTYGGAAAEGPDDFAIATELCDRAEAQAGDDALVLVISALERHNLRGDGEAGLALAERALALNPHSYLVVDLTATIHMQRGRPDSAIELFHRAIHLSPNSPYNAWSMDCVAACHLEAGRYAEAVEWETRSLAIHSGWGLPFVTLAVAHAMQDQLDEAGVALDRFLAVRPGATIRGLLDSLPPGTRGSVERIWSEGLRRAGLPHG